MLGKRLAPGLLAQLASSGPGQLTCRPGVDPGAQPLWRQPSLLDSLGPGSGSCGHSPQQTGAPGPGVRVQWPRGSLTPVLSPKFQGRKPGGPETSLGRERGPPSRPPPAHRPQAQVRLADWAPSVGSGRDSVLRPAGATHKALGTWGLGTPAPVATRGAAGGSHLHRALRPLW